MLIPGPPDPSPPPPGVWTSISSLALLSHQERRGRVDGGNRHYTETFWQMFEL